MASEDIFDKNDHEKTWNDPSDSDEDLGELGQQFKFSASEDEESQSEIADLKSQNEDLKNEISKLKNQLQTMVDSNEELHEKVGHMKWHIGVYISALENVPGGLAIYHDAFRQYRDTENCPECQNTELLEKNKELEQQIESLKSQHPSSPVLGSKRKSR